MWYPPKIPIKRGNFLANGIIRFWLIKEQILDGNKDEYVDNSKYVRDNKLYNQF